MSDLEQAYNALAGKFKRYTDLWRYYDGDQPLVYSARRLEEIFRGIDAKFSENWCGVVVNATHERISLQRFEVTGRDADTERLNAIWRETGMTLDDDDAHLAALVVGESFLLAWRDEQGIEAYYNDPRLCHIEYDPESPRRKLFAAKWWVDGDGKRRLTLYYPDRFEYYVSRGKSDNVTSYKAFIPAEEESAPNPFGVIPVFHMRREVRAVKSELADVIEPQNAINKLLADMMIAAEFGAMKQRYIVSQADVSELKSNHYVWNIPAADGEGEGTQVGEFSATDLTNYLKAIESLTAAVGTITRTPRHYFYGQGGDPSGEALIAMEAPLNKKCERYIERFRWTMREFGAFLLQLDGRNVNAGDISPIYDDPRTIQPLTQSLIRQNNVNSGIPLVTTLRDEGWDEAELDQLAEDRQAEQSAAQSSLASALMARQREFDQGER